MVDSAVFYDPSPPIMLFYDSEAGRSSLEHLTHRIEGRIGIAAPIMDAGRHLSAATQIGAVFVDAAGLGSDAFERLLDRLNIAAAEDRFASVVSVSPDLVDLVAARAPHADVAILCRPSEVEQITAAAIAISRTNRVPQFNEENGRLRQLSEEVGRIARTLAALSVEPGDDRTQPAAHPTDVEEIEPPTARDIRMLIRIRRLREQFFSADLFADPAWDILLDLTAARAEGRQVAVSSLCIAASVPATTALRWIKSLTEEGVLVRVADPHDGRRVFIELSPTAADGMAAYFQALRRMVRAPATRG